MQPLQYFLKPLPEKDFKRIPIKCLKEFENFLIFRVNSFNPDDPVAFMDNTAKKLRTLLPDKFEFLLLPPNISMLQLVPDNGTECPKCGTLLDEERISEHEGICGK